MQFDTDEQSNQPNIKTIVDEISEKLPYVESIHCDITQRNWPIPLKCWCRGGERPPLSHILLALTKHPNSPTSEAEKVNENEIPENEIKGVSIDCSSKNPDLQFECSAFSDITIEDNKKKINKIHINTGRDFKNSKKTFSREIKSEDLNGVQKGRHLNKQKRRKSTRSKHEVNDHASSEDNDGWETASSLDHYSNRTDCSFQRKTGWEYNPEYKLNSFADFPSLSASSTDAVPSESNKNISAQPSQLARVLKEIKLVDSDSKKPDKFIIENLPLDLNKLNLEELLEGFGHIVQVSFHKVNSGLTATVSMSPETDCNWIVLCLNGTCAFGANSQPLVCYVVQS